MSQKSKSFRLTTPDYMRGKRVMPGLRWVYHSISIVTLGAFAAALVMGFRMAFDDRALFGSPVAENIMIIGICALAYSLPMFGLPRLFARLGVITREQAEDFFHSFRRWPESWLESIPDSPKNRPSDDSSDPPGRDGAGAARDTNYDD